MQQDESEDVYFSVVPHSLVAEAAVVPQADRRPEPGDGRDYLVSILRSELQAALALMEHRERWWTDGLRNAEANVGMAMDRIQAGEHHAAMEMNAQVNSLVDTLRATQERAERTSVAMQDQQHLERSRSICG